MDNIRIKPLKYPLPKVFLDIKNPVINKNKGMHIIDIVRTTVIIYIRFELTGKL